METFPIAVRPILALSSLAVAGLAVGQLATGPGSAARDQGGIASGAECLEADA